MAKIRKLPDDLVHQIAAGEVVLRPASVVKELLENSIDAGGRRIRVRVEGGGRELVRVTDDGEGIPPDELPLAVRPHATSKVRSVDDIEAVHTLGFRGEALSSIAAVSELAIRSRVEGADAGASLEVRAGRVGEVETVGCPPGTQVTVRHLFHNVPARRKFLKSDRAETRAASRVAGDLGLAVLDLDLRVESQSGLLLDLRPTGDPVRRVADVFSDEIASELIRVDASRGPATLQALVAPPHACRGTAIYQRTFLNGRPLDDPMLKAAVREAYRGLLLPKRHPVAFCWLAVDPEVVDVNVHPQKGEVRFEDGRTIFGLVSGAIREALEGRRDRPTYRPDSDDPFARQASSTGSSEGGGAGSGETAPAAASGQRELAAVAAAEDAADEGDPAAGTARPFVQLHDRYVVHETDEGFEVIDQHALHEKVLYARLADRADRERTPSQRLLIPLVITPDEAGLEAFRGAGDALAEAGFDAGEIDGGRLLLRAVPAGLPDGDWSARFAGILETLGRRDRVEAADLRHAIWALTACKAAVKFGDGLEPEEVASLLAARRETPTANLCPHGRPTALSFSLDELERRFER